MQKIDVVIVGGGIVGLTAALAIRKQTSLSVAIVEPNGKAELSVEPHLRVSAINAASKSLFENIDVWQAISNSRLQAYNNMHVWEKDGLGKLDFSQDDIAKRAIKDSNLGWIIENDVVRNALYQQAELDSNISFIHSRLQTINLGESETFITFAEHSPVIAKLVIGADGANSVVRQQLNIPLNFRDYDHHALVTTVECSQGHQNTAWQVFLKDGPLAFLPLFKENTCSIVWSLPPDEAERLKHLESGEFEKEIIAASDGKLGNITVKAERVTFPLTMRLVDDFVKDRVVLIGDAAHTIHPLAGQGVNLGLVDAAAIAQTLKGICQENSVSALTDIANKQALGKFARWRKSDASDMIMAMEGIKQGFSFQQVLPKFIRSVGMTVINNVSPLKKLLIKQAMGQTANLPELSKPKDAL